MEKTRIVQGNEFAMVLTVTKGNGASYPLEQLQSAEVELVCIKGTDCATKIENGKIIAEVPTLSPGYYDIVLKAICNGVRVRGVSFNAFMIVANNAYGNKTPEDYNGTDAYSFTISLPYNSGANMEESSTTPENTQPNAPHEPGKFSEEQDLDKAIEEEQKECKRGNPDSFWAKWLDWIKQERNL